MDCDGLKICQCYFFQNFIKNTRSIKFEFKAIPHKDCRADTQSAFSSDCQSDAGIPAYFKEFWAKMAEKMQAYVRQSAQCDLCAVLP